MLSIFCLHLLIQIGSCCRTASLNFLDISGIVGQIPYLALDICVKGRENGVDYSIMYGYYSTDNIIIKMWDNNQYCNGNFTNIQTLIFPKDLTLSIDCSTNNCSYAIFRQYTSPECVDTGDYMDIPISVNYCLKVQINDNAISDGPHDSYYYASAICTNDSAINIYLYEFSDCSNSPAALMEYYKDGECNLDNQYVDIISCNGYSNDIGADAIPDIVYYMVPILVNGISCIINIWITVKIFSNLFECVCNSRVSSTCFQFSDLHNWIVEPTKSNKIFAIICPIIYIINRLIMILFLFHGLYFHSGHDMVLYQTEKIVYDISLNIGDIIFDLFMVTTLEYHMNYDDLMANMIPRKLIIFVKILIPLIGFNVIAEIVLISTYVDFDDFYQYQTIQICIFLPINWLIELIILYLYYCGLNNVCHFYYSKHWEEFDQYGENERTHEIIITITRVSVAVLMGVVVKFLDDVTIIIWMKCLYTNRLAYFMTAWVSIAFDAFLISIKSLLIYFIYPFAHRHYEKICKYCDIRMQQYFKRRLQDQVKNGAFDGIKYVSNNSCCVCVRRKNIYQQQIDDPILNDQQDNDEDL